jgi:hypothetical protein
MEEKVSESGLQALEAELAGSPLCSWVRATACAT